MKPKNKSDGMISLPRLLSPAEVADLFKVSRRTIEEQGKRWNRLSHERRDPFLPSSPRNGLRRVAVTSRRARHDFRDVRGYMANATLEEHGLPLENWRRPLAKNEEGCEEK